MRCPTSKTTERLCGDDRRPRPRRAESDEALRANGLEENTIVMFTSDNGGAHMSASPISQTLSRLEDHLLRGGIHVPISCNGRPHSGGTVYDGPAAHVDIFTTAAVAAGAVPPSDRIIDGVDLVSLALGEAPRPDRTLFWRSGHYKALLSDGWKLQVAERPARNWLFNLAVDPTEKYDLSEAEPAKLAEMIALLNEIDSEQSDPIWPALLEGPVMIDRPLGGAPRGPDDEYVLWPN